MEYTTHTGNQAALAQPGPTSFIDAAQDMGTDADKTEVQKTRVAFLKRHHGMLQVGVFGSALSHRFRRATVFTLCFQ